MKRFSISLLALAVIVSIVAAVAWGVSTDAKPKLKYTAYGEIFGATAQSNLGLSGPLQAPTDGMTVTTETDSQLGTVYCIATDFSILTVSFAGQGGSTEPQAFLPGSVDGQSTRLFAPGNACVGDQAAVTVPTNAGVYVALSGN
jgi:hypothetical protein